MSPSQCVLAVSTTLSSSQRLHATYFQQSFTHVLQRSCLFSLIFHSCITHKDSSVKVSKGKCNSVISFYLQHWSAHEMLKRTESIRPDVTWTDLICSQKAHFTFTQTFDYFKLKCWGKRDLYVPGNKVSRVGWLAGWLCHHSTSQSKCGSLLTNYCSQPTLSLLSWLYQFGLSTDL